MKLLCIFGVHSRADRSWEDNNSIHALQGLIMMIEDFNHPESPAITEQEEPTTVRHLTHLDEHEHIHMVDVTERPETTREAIARGRIRMAPETVHLIATNQITKGSVLEVAKVAGIMAAKQTPQIIPLCHPLPVIHIVIQFT